MGIFQAFNNMSSRDIEEFIEDDIGVCDVIRL